MAPTTLRGWRDDLEELQAALLAARVGAQTNGEKATALEVRTETLEGELASERARSAKLEKQVEKLQRELASMKRRAIGPKSERMPTPEDEARKLEPPVAPGGNTNPEKRAANRERLKALPTRCVPHRIPDCERRCPSCGEEVRPIGSGDRSYEIEWTPGHLERRVHVVETGRCPCKMHYARGPAPERVTQGCSFGPGFIAKLAVEKCGDAIPVYRMEKAMRRAGIPVSRSTMNRQLLLAGRALLPLWQAAYDLMRVDAHVQADETSFRLQT